MSYKVANQPNICMNCGNSNTLDSKYCSKCGNNMQDGYKPQQQYPPQQYPPQQQYPGGYMPYPHRSNNTALYVILAILGVFIALPFIIFILLGLLLV